MAALVCVGQLEVAASVCVGQAGSGYISMCRACCKLYKDQPPLF